MLPSLPMIYRACLLAIAHIMGISLSSSLSRLLLFSPFAQIPLQSKSQMDLVHLCYSSLRGSLFLGGKQCRACPGSPQPSVSRAQGTCGAQSVSNLLHSRAAGRSLSEGTRATPDLLSCPHTSETAGASAGLEFAAQTSVAQTPLASHIDGPALSHFPVTAGTLCVTCRLFLQGFLSHAPEFAPSLSTMLTNSLSSSFQKPMNFSPAAIGSVGL